MYFFLNFWRFVLFLTASLLMSNNVVAQVEPPELAKEEARKLIQQEPEEGTKLGTDTPQGIENIGRDMIILVDQIIFGEQDPTQRLDIEPLLQDIFTAIDLSPVINKAQVAVSQSLLNIERTNYSILGSPKRKVNHWNLSVL